ncbi:unnamed protein product [Trichobilharzia szidati]|nr:unnamed protein product [Trichobilharzia szidati]
MVVAQTDIQDNNNNYNNKADENLQTADGIQLKSKPNNDNSSANHPQVNTPNQQQSINSSTHQNDSGHKINNESKPQQTKSTDVCAAADDNEEKILAELFNRKQLLLQRLSEEMEKYEQLCWEEMVSKNDK